MAQFAQHRVGTAGAGGGGGNGAGNAAARFDRCCALSVTADGEGSCCRMRLHAHRRKAWRQIDLNREIISAFDSAAISPASLLSALNSSSESEVEATTSALAPAFVSTAEAGDGNGDDTDGDGATSRGDEGRAPTTGFALKSWRRAMSSAFLPDLARPRRVSNAWRSVTFNLFSFLAEGRGGGGKLDDTHS